MILEVDSKVEVDLPTEDRPWMGPYGALLKRYKELLSRTWRVVIWHVYREENMAADWIANLAAS